MEQYRQPFGFLRITDFTTGLLKILCLKSPKIFINLTLF